jgi:hypothetical protein
MDIHYIYGSRIQTPSTVNNAQVELGDTNNDGVIDILDAGEVTSGSIWDANNDGIIDILDAAEILANGGIPNSPSPPTITLNPFDSPKTCPEGQVLTIIPIGNGITTTGCTSIPTQPPIPGIGQESWICPPGKVRGFVLDYDSAAIEELGYVPIKFNGECTCAEASVNVAEIVVLIGTAGYAAARKSIRNGILNELGYFYQIKEEYNTLIKDSWKIIDQVISDIKQLDNKILKIRIEIHTFDPTIKNPAILKELEIDLRNELAKKSEKERYLNEYNEYIDALTRKIDSASFWIQMLLAKLEDLSTITDPTALVTLFLGSLLPINWIVPKECGSYSQLDENCNCVPISSGSYSPTSLNLQIPQGYNIIENL